MSEPRLDAEYNQAPRWKCAVLAWEFLEEQRLITAKEAAELKDRLRKMAFVQKLKLKL